ncbi:LysR family transcriptional regulator [Microvirga sp. 2TAF3]|uniref:LysR family transcriptional regulator n=1 Tax=Microvirga sp. 2TAF3 TaxID=3233014 RepID=UPI003F99C2DD
MDRIHLGWELYRSFLAVLREGSLSGAARALGLTQPTIGRHVDALEQALGIGLFIRSQHGLAPTDAALEMRPYAEAMEATSDAMLRAASGSSGEVRGAVRVTASEVIGAEVLPPILTKLREEHPDLVVELVLTNRMEDLLQRHADIAVRMVRPTQEALLARRIGEIELGLHAHRDYLARRGTPGSLADLESHAVIGFDRENAFIRGLQRRGIAVYREMFALRTDSDLAQLAAIRAGFGIGVCQVSLAKRDARLVRVMPDAFAPKLDTWIAMHEDLRASRRCRIAFDALAAGLSDYVGPAR